MAEVSAERTQCVIAGGGPAGVMLGYLLARAGVRVTVLEKHADFFRDFRGDTVHPSTLQVMHELGLLPAFLQRPHQELHAIRGQIGGDSLQIADLSRLPTQAKFVALMPQWDFLDFLAEEGRKYPGFTLLMSTKVEGLILEQDRTAGVRATGADGSPIEIRGDLVVGADGRSSDVRQAAGMAVRELSSPIDVLWMRLSKRPDDAPQSLGRINFGRLLVMLDRGDYWQCAYVIPKGGYEAVRARGLDALRSDIAKVAPELEPRLGEVASWDNVKLLTVRVDRLERWHKPGLLFIGDAAHAMSPIGGIGINLAIQDAVAAADRLARPLREGRLTEKDLAAFERRRLPPTRITQAVQVLVQDRVLGRVLGRDRPITAPAVLRLVDRTPALQGLLARFVGMGVRPEHVSPEIQNPEIQNPEVQAAGA